ncbi:hypothetical protein BDZ94DRAFT_1255804 [Collybia nuda]|uniref:Uncharacterized protein n=1 Tax=Collybia nuda TaxID=64659 RepID=A0A9P5Y9H4_9AGAR|nr:hypothetical protein BDZ94DRAFT_1255804 [Collybia nuda]
MFNITFSRLTIIQAVGRQRHLFSSVLLTQTRKIGNVADHIEEAKFRGISTKENNIILRTQEYERNKNLNHFAFSKDSPVVVTGARAFSTTLTRNSEGFIPGIPPASQSTPPPPKVFMNTNIPDISEPTPDLPIQIPYVPDFWESASMDRDPMNEEPLPKLLVVAGAETHPNGGPSHNLHDENAPTEIVKLADARISLKGGGGLWDDLVEDLGLPPTKKLRAVFLKTFS